jgi:hypothetical protein
MSVASALLWDFTRRLYLPTFRKNLSALSSKVKQSKKNCLTLHGGNYELYRNVGNDQSAPRNIPEVQTNILNSQAKWFEDYRVLIVFRRYFKVANSEDLACQLV